MTMKHLLAALLSLSLLPAPGLAQTAETPAPVTAPAAQPEAPANATAPQTHTTDRDIAADAAALSAEVEDDRGFITRFLERNLSGAGRQVVLTGFRGALSSRATFEELTIADADGVWITLRNGAIQWNRSALFARWIEIQELSAAEIILPRLPKGEGERTAEIRDFALPTLPVGINIDHIAAQRVDIGEPVIGEAAVVSLDGSMNLTGGEGTAKLAINRVDGKRGVFDVDASYSNATTNLKIDVTLDEDKSGLFANAVGLHERPAVRAEIKGEGPLREFAAVLRLATDGQDRVTGRVSARSQVQDDTPGTGFRLELSGDVASLLPPDNRAFFGTSSQLLAEGWRGENGRVSLPVLLIDTEALNLTGSVTTNETGAPQSLVVLMTLGEDAGATTLPVRLPFGGEPTDVRSGSLQISYDAAQGSGWTVAGRIGDITQNRNAIGALTLNGAGSVVLDGEDLREVLGKLSFGAEGLALADPGLQQALGDRITGESDFDFTPGNALQLDNFTLSGQDFGLHGKVLADGLRSGITVSGDLDAAYENLSRLSTLAGRPLTGQASASISGLYTVLSRGFDVEAEVTGTDITVNQPQADRLLAGEAVITASARRDENGIEIRELKIGSPRIDLEGGGTISSTATDLKAQLRLSSLTDADPAMAGSLLADAAVTGAPGSRRVTVSGEATDLQLGIAALDDALKGRSNLTAIAQEKPDGSYGVETFRLANPQLTADGKGSFGAGALDGTLDLDVPDLAALRPGFSGALKATARATEQDGRRMIEATGTGENLRLGQQDVDGALTGTTQFKLSAEQAGEVITVRDLDLTNDQMRATVAGVFGPGVTDLTANAEIASLAAFGRGWRGSMRLDGSLQDEGAGVRRLVVDGSAQNLSLGQANVDGMLEGETRLTVRGTEQNGVLTIEQAVIDNPKAQVNAQGTLGGGRTDMTGRINLADLSALGLGMRGRFAAEGSFADDGTGVRRLAVDGVANDLSLGQAQADAALAGAIRVTLRGAEQNGVLTVEQAVVDNARLNATARGTLARGASDLTATLRADSLAFLGGGFGGSVNASGRLVESAAGRRITADGTAGGLRIGNDKVDQLLSGQTTFDLAALQSPQGRISIERLNARNGQLTITADGDPQAALNLNAALSDLALLVPGLQGPATVQGTVVQGPQDFTLNLNATAPGGTRASIAGTAARDFSTADIRTSGVTDAALANPFLRVRSIEGPVDFDLRLNGPPALESLTGRVTLPNARLSDPKLGYRVESLSGTADLNRGLINVNATGNVAAGGRLTVTGPIDLRGGTSLDLRAQLDGVVLRDPNLYETIVDGSVSITGNPADGPIVTGVLNLGPTEIRIPSTGLGGARDIPDVTHLRDRTAVRATRAKAGLLPFPSADSRIAGMTSPPATPPANPARLDVTINAPNQVFVRGRGVDAELGGQIRITGRANAIVPVGQLELIRGRVDLLGNRFDMTEGLIEMQGSMIPILRLVAQTERDGITTRIIIDGELRDPDVRFESDPPLPDEEVLSQLLFGRGMDNISPLQAAQLANAIAVLAGTGSAGIVSNLRDSVGLDDLDLATDDEGDVTVRAGKYLSRNVYTDVTVDADGKSKIDLNLDVTPSVTARGSVGSDGESTLGVFFERDY